LAPEGFGADFFDEVADDVEVDVGFEEGDANLAESFVDVLVGEGALAAEGLEGALEFFGEVFKHGLTSLQASCGPTRTALLRAGRSYADGES